MGALWNGQQPLSGTICYVLCVCSCHAVLLLLCPSSPLHPSLCIPLITQGEWARLPIHVLLKPSPFIPLVATPLPTAVAAAAAPVCGAGSSSGPVVLVP